MRPYQSSRCRTPIGMATASVARTADLSHVGVQICTCVMKLLVPGCMWAFTASSVMPKPYMKHLTLVGVCVIWLSGPAWQDDTPHVLMEVHSPFAGRRCCGQYLGHNLWRGRGQPVR
jgi:hypothetical protein